MIGLVMLANAMNIGYFIGARDLQIVCAANAAQCSYYVAGASDALSFMQAHGLSKPLACPAPSIGLDKQTVAVIRYMNARPGDLTGSGFGIVAAALAAAFPSPNRGG